MPRTKRTVAASIRARMTVAFTLLEICSMPQSKKSTFIQRMDSTGLLSTYTCASLNRQHKYGKSHNHMPESRQQSEPFIAPFARR